MNGAAKLDDAAVKSTGKKTVGAASLQSMWPLFVLGGFWTVAALFVGIAGDFPLNDDWIYAEGVQHFLQTGQIRLLACAPACIFHIISAAAVCKLTGFSYTVLRGVGFAWSVLGSIFLYGACRELRVSKAAALLLTLCFVANPLYICLAFSFMTDPAAVALTLGYMYFLFRAIRRNRELDFLLASVALLGATLVRQNMGALALVNLAIFVLVAMKKRFSPSLLLGLVVAPLATAYLADKWMLSTNDFNSLYIWYKGMVAKQVAHMLHAPSAVIPTLLQVTGEICAYLGIFFLPATLNFLPSFARLFKKNQAFSAVWPMLCSSMMVFSFAKFIAEGRWMPFNQNLLRLPELGAHTILGINLVALSTKWRQALTWTSAFAGFIFAVLICDTAQRLFTLSINAFGKGAARFSVRADATKTVRTISSYNYLVAGLAALGIFGFQFAFTALQSTFSDLDRYYLFPGLAAVPCLALAWRFHRSKVNWLASLPILLILAGYSFAATQDLMAWNRARWDAIVALEKQGVAYQQIEGGAEYNYARDPNLFKNLILHDTWYELTHRGEAPRDQWRWWSIHGEDYIVSFSPVPDYELVAKNTYWSALSGTREILTLKHVVSPKK